MIERYSLGKVADAYDQMASGRARFRVVLTMGKESAMSDEHPSGGAGKAAIGVA